MTVARFVELLTSKKIPNATKDANGLMSKDLIPYNGLLGYNTQRRGGI